MNIKQFSSDDEIAHLIKPILKVLQEVQENSTSNLINLGALLFLKG